METLSSTSSVSVPQEPSTYEELSMHQSMLFSNSLKDLKNLRDQLYSAAEYFELSYSNDDQKQIVVNTLKDYTVQVLVNTVDHLGSVTYKVNDLLDEKAAEVSGTGLRVSCIEQRLRTCQEYIDREGLSQQSLVIATPKYHKRYILPVGQSVNSPGYAEAKYQAISLDDEEEDWHQVRTAIQSSIRETRTKRETPTSRETPRSRGTPTYRDISKSRESPKIKERPSSSVRKGRSQSPTPRHGSFFFSEKRSPSPLATSRPLARSESVSSRANTPNSRRYPSAPQKSASMRVRNEKDGQKEIEQQPSKSKRLLKALLSRRKSRQDPSLYTYLDEY